MKKILLFAFLVLCILVLGVGKFLFFPDRTGNATPVPQDISFTVTEMVSDLEYPWAVETLPGGGYLITLKAGDLIQIMPDGERISVYGLPPIVSERQGGLLDVAIDQDFETNQTIYVSYVGGRKGANTGTEVIRGELRNGGLENVQTLFKAAPKVNNGLHFGSRILPMDDGTLYITLGERYQMDRAQDPSNHHGALVRINKDGSIPQDNPFINTPDAKPEIYSYGHRNIQGIVYHPDLDEIIIHEHGPRGGDEINIIKAGANYGWPLKTYGIDYSGRPIDWVSDLDKDQFDLDTLTPPLLHWTPSIAPCGMAIYSGPHFPQWSGDLFVGALAGTHLRYVDLENGQPAGQHILLDALGRIRDVHMGRDGYLYVITDSLDGALYRIEPDS